MSQPVIGLCTITLHLHGMTSLKAKRSVIKSLLTKARQKFNVSASEVDALDKWQLAVIAIAEVSNSTFHTQKTLRNILKWIEQNYPEVVITQHEIEIL